MDGPWKMIHLEKPEMLLGECRAAEDNSTRCKSKGASHNPPSFEMSNILSGSDIIIYRLICSMARYSFA